MYSVKIKTIDQKQTDRSASRKPQCGGVAQEPCNLPFVGLVVNKFHGFLHRIENFSEIFQSVERRARNISNLMKFLEVSQHNDVDYHTGFSILDFDFICTTINYNKLLYTNSSDQKKYSERFFTKITKKRTKSIGSREVYSLVKNRACATLQ